MVLFLVFYIVYIVFKVNTTVSNSSRFINFHLISVAI